MSFEKVFAVFILCIMLFGCKSEDMPTSPITQFAIENQTDGVIYVGIAETIPGYELDSHFVFECADPDIFLNKIRPGDTITCKYFRPYSDKKFISIIGYKESTLNNHTTKDIVDNNMYDYFRNYSYDDIINMSSRIICY